MKVPAVYLLASARNGTLYVGVTSNLVQRIWQHREGIVEGFTSRYGVKTLVWYEIHENMDSVIAREKAIKKWNRAWKLALIEKANPAWRDLWRDITGGDAQAPAPRGDSPKAPSPAPGRHSREEPPAGPHRHSREEPPAGPHRHSREEPLAGPGRRSREEQPAAPGRHSRASGNPESPGLGPEALDSRLRGNDEGGRE